MMRFTSRVLPCWALAALLTGPAARAEQRAMAAPQSSEPGGQAQALQPGEVQRLFDAYVVMQAQDALRLSEAQYGPFVTRVKALQDLRRQHQQARMKILRELARAAGENPPADDGVLRERLKALEEHDTKAAAELQKAYAAVDEVLDVRQRARFRMFEENMERKKFDLLMRARQRRAPARNPRMPPP